MFNTHKFEWIYGNSSDAIKCVMHLYTPLIRATLFIIIKVSIMFDFTIFKSVYRYRCISNYSRTASKKKTNDIEVYCKLLSTVP